MKEWESFDKWKQFSLDRGGGVCMQRGEYFFICHLFSRAGNEWLYAAWHLIFYSLRWGKFSKSLSPFFFLSTSGASVSYPKPNPGMIPTPLWKKWVGSHPHHISVHHCSTVMTSLVPKTWNMPITSRSSVWLQFLKEYVQKKKKFSLRMQRKRSVSDAARNSQHLIRDRIRR